MIVIRLTSKNTEATIKQTVAALNAGKTVVYPTETIYGLGCAAGKRETIKKIYRIKGRSKNKVLPFLLADMRMARKYLKLNQAAHTLAKKYWPGPLSLVLPTTASGRKILGAADAGVRISGHRFATKLVKVLGRPLVSTSANPSGRPAAASATTAIKYFKNLKFKPDLIIDAGRLPRSKGSTFLDLTRKEPKVLRQGDIKIYL